MHHDSQKNIFCDDFYLLFPIFLHKGFWKVFTFEEVTNFPLTLGLIYNQFQTLFFKQFGISEQKTFAEIMYGPLNIAKDCPWRIMSYGLWSLQLNNYSELSI